MTRVCSHRVARLGPRFGRVLRSDAAPSWRPPDPKAWGGRRSSPLPALLAPRVIPARGAGLCHRGSRVRSLPRVPAISLHRLDHGEETRHLLSSPSRPRRARSAQPPHPTASSKAGGGPPIASRGGGSWGVCAQPAAERRQAAATRQPSAFAGSRFYTRR